MLRITRIYNQNRFKIWTIAIIAIFIIAIVQIYNSAYNNLKKPNTSQNTKENIIQSNVVDYEKAGNSIISNVSIDRESRDEIQKTLENFLIYCCNAQPQQAYELLTDDCKEILYPSLETFDENYCKNIYKQKQTYSFQLWSVNTNTYVYLVKIFQDMLSTGRDTSKNYLQDYITVTKVDGQYLLNVNKFVKLKKINKEVEKNDVKVKVISSEVYMDYEIYQIEVRNNRNKEIMLDTLENDNNTYVQNQDLIHIKALLYENKEDELTILPGETKKISIKFNNTFIAENHISKVVFSNIVIDKEKYSQDNNNSEAKMQVEINVYN